LCWSPPKKGLRDAAQKAVPCSGRVTEYPVAKLAAPLMPGPI
jgi:hypothetical protein